MRGQLAAAGGRCAASATCQTPCLSLAFGNKHMPVVMRGHLSLQKDKMEMTVSQLFIFISLSQRGTSDLTRKDPKTRNTVRPHGEINREPHHESLFSRFNGGIAGHSPAPALKSVSSDCQIKPAHETSLSGRINMHPGHLE